MEVRKSTRQLETDICINYDLIAIPMPHVFQTTLFSCHYHAVVICCKFNAKKIIKSFLPCT